jgi:hypothetical protein
VVIKLIAVVMLVVVASVLSVYSLGATDERAFGQRA